MERSGMKDLMHVFMQKDPKEIPKKVSHHNRK